MKKQYYLFNWSETKKILLGSFRSEDSAWKHYWKNLSSIKEEQNTLEPDARWFMNN